MKEMRKMIIIGCTIAVSAVLVAEAAHAGDSAPLLIDTRMGVRESTGDETLTYSGTTANCRRAGLCSPARLQS